MLCGGRGLGVIGTSDTGPIQRHQYAEVPAWTTHWDGTTYQNTIVIHMYIHAHSNKQLHTDIENIKTDDDDQMS